MSLNNQRGSVLIYFTAMLALLSAIIDGVTAYHDVATNNFRAVHEKKQAFYISEGTRAIVTTLMQSYLMATPNPTDESLSNHLNTVLPPLIPAPFTISPVDAKILSFTPNAIISAGPFAGMNGPITTLEVKFTVNSPSSLFNGNVVQNMDMQMAIAYVSMFQFLVFFDVGQAFIQSGPDMKANGRVHSNGDLCTGGNGGSQYFLKVTAAGRLLANNDNRCADSSGPGMQSNTKIATDGTFTTFADMTRFYDYGCTNCNGSGLPWQGFQLARWHGQALDQANSVQRLKLPGAGLGLTQIQQAGGIGATNNGNNLRFIIDPILTATDSPSIKTYKFAHNADLRILNGVWYLKNPGDEFAWPGIPIWSDHPGRFIENGISVGQDDIRDYWSATANPWPAAPATPKNYSYYEYDRTNKTLFNDTNGVISYGTLFNTGDPDVRWRPGSWVDSGNSSLCANNPITCPPGGCGLLDAVTAAPTCPGAPAAGRDPAMATLLLNSTRGGFRNGHIYQLSPGSSAERQRRSRVLPINFDVKQLQNALANTDPGELGSYFGVGRIKGAPFNGVIYISSMWPGALSGFGGGSPAEVPTQGSVADAKQIAPAHTAVQEALPQPLCSDNGSAGVAFDGQGPLAAPIARFTIPNCDSYSAAPTAPNPAIPAWPNVLRVTNGRDLNNGQFPAGLSIISNLPTYLAGDFNATSTQGSMTSTPWIPALVGGDKIILLSNAWDDASDGWDKNPSSTNRIASATTYNSAILSDPSLTLTTLLENWYGKDLIQNGSLVFGHNDVYALHANYCCGNVTYEPPNRTFNFDPHFSLITNQPPGTPVFPLAAILMWTNPQ